MKRFALSLSLAVAATGCDYDRYSDEDAVEGEEGPDSNLDGVDDYDQSFGLGYDPDFGWYVIFFNGPHHPAGMVNSALAGYGCSMYDGDPTDDWEQHCFDLRPYRSNGKTLGWAAIGLKPGIHEMVPVDVDGFDPNGAGWTDPAVGQTDADEPGFFVRHVDGPNCPVDMQRPAIHYGWVVLGDGSIQPLYDSVAPPDPACN